MDCKEFMLRVGVRSELTVKKWLEKEMVPGVSYDKERREWVFSESSRRPHIVRLKTTAPASKIRASMIYACIKRHHISAKTYHRQMGENEFNAYVADLENAGLIKVRREGEWVYYDSTSKSDSYKDKSLAQIERFVINCMAAVTEAATKAIVSTYFPAA